MVETPLSLDTLSRPSQRRADPDAHGQAALLLIESVIHGLVESGSMTRNAAVDAVQTAADVKVDVAEEAGESNAVMQESLGLLLRIEQSLKSDDLDNPEPTLKIV